MSDRTKHADCKRMHRLLTAQGVPRHKDGNRLGLRKRRALAERKVVR